jgi:hypothetical protein
VAFRIHTILSGFWYTPLAVVSSIGAVVEMGILSTLKRLLMESRFLVATKGKLGAYLMKSIRNSNESAVTVLLNDSGF